MRIRDERGAALFIVLIVVMILMVLSTVFVFAMAAEGIQAAAHDHSVQAYYFARSGVEVALGWLQARNFALVDGTTYHLSGDLSAGFVEIPVAGAPIAVAITKFTTPTEEKLEIRATGRYLEEEEQVVLIMRKELDPRSFSERGWVEKVEGAIEGDYIHSSHSDINWTDETGNNSHIRPTGSEVWSSTLPVLFRADAANPVLLFNRDTAQFSAPEIHFESPLDIKNSALMHLFVPRLIFRDSVDLKSGAVLCLTASGTGYVYFAVGVDIHGHNDIPAGAYSFTGTVCLPAGAGALTPIEIPEQPPFGGWGGDLWN